jgi:hypothetical protein
MSKQKKRNSKKIKKPSKKDLKNVIKSFIEHPLDNPFKDKIEEDTKDVSHPEVKEDIKQHVEEEEEKKQKKDVKKQEENIDSSDDVDGLYEIPQDYAYEHEKESTDYVLKEIKERVEGVSAKKDEIDQARVSDYYEPGELLEGDYEKLKVKILEKGKILPTGFSKYLTPMRKRIMEVLSIGKYKYKKN